MAETIKVTKKDIQAAKAPDAVLEAGTSAFDWIVEHRNLLLGLIAAVVVGSIAWSVVQSSRESQRQEVGGQLSAAVALLNRPVVEGQPSDADSFASADEKRKAVEAAFSKVMTDHPGTDAARVANLELSLFKLREGDADAAITGIKAYLENGSGQDLRLQAYESLGYAYEQKGDLAAANDAFTKLAEAGAVGRSLYHRGRVAAAQGNKDEARKLFEQVTKEHGEEAVAGDAKVRLELLDLAPANEAGITAPPPAPEAPAKGKGKGK